MTECPKVSVIVPVYKTEKYLRRCIDSLRKQTLKEIEIILVDDGSPDGCPKLCDEYAKEDGRIRVIHKKNGGLGFARNSGLEAALGEYVGFVDSDDYVDEDMFEKLYTAAQKENVQLVLSSIRFVGGNVFGKDDKRTDVVYFKEDTLFETKSDIENLLLGIAGALPEEANDSRYGMSVCKNIYKREIIESNNIRFLSERDILSEDALFMLDFTKHTKRAAGITGVYYNYCRNGDSLSKSYNPSRLHKSAVFVKEVEKRIMNDIPKDIYKIYLDRLAQALGRVLCSQEIMYASENKTDYFALRKKLKEICTTKEISEALKHYPWYRLPPKQAVFAFSMKYRLYFLQKILVYARSS